MKKLLLFYVMALWGCFSYAQNSFNYAGELSKSVSTPNSPEAQAFSQYGNITANLNTGTTSVSVPLYTYKGIEMNLPISLSYDMNARKVESIASNIGMGWSLSLGGRVSRIQNGNPDELINGANNSYDAYQTLTWPEGGKVAFRQKYLDYKDKASIGGGTTSYGTFIDQGQAVDYFRFLDRVQVGSYDLQLDHYTLNAPGLNEKVIFIFDETSQSVVAKMEGNPNIEVVYTGQGTWIVTKDNGTQYYFEVAETTESSNLNDITTIVSTEKAPRRINYYSSWLLTKIISPNKKDTYTFFYDETLTPWLNAVSTRTSMAIDTRPAPNQSWPNTNLVDIDNSYRITEKPLTMVKHNDQTIYELELLARADHQNDTRVGSIKVKSPLDQSVINKIKFSNDAYFGNISGNPDEADLRLKLDKIEIAGRPDGNGNYDYFNEYSFTYESPSSLPARTSFAQDEFGYFNGQTNNNKLYPKWILPDNHILTGAIRDFDETSAKVGLLTKMTYPTGGFIEFIYGPHRDGQVTPNGIRIDSIKNYTEVGALASKKYYEYIGQVVNLSVAPILKYQNQLPGINGGSPIDQYYRRSQPALGDEPYIYYSQVIEKVAENNGLTEHHFFDATGGAIIDTQAPFITFYATNITKGMLEKQIVNNSLGQEVRKSENAYTPYFEATHYGFAITDHPDNSQYGIKLVSTGSGTEVQPQLTSEDPNTCGCYYLSPSYARLKPLIPTTTLAYLDHSSSISTETLNGQSIVSTSSSDYDATLGNLLVEAESSTGEDNTTLVSKYYYPQQLTIGPGALEDLVNANRISSPVKTESYERITNGSTTTDHLLATQMTNFQTISYGSNLDRTLPESIEVARENDVLEKRMLFEDYDDHGNLTQVSKPSSSTRTVYIWGYDNRFPVAKIDNATYATLKSQIPSVILAVETETDPVLFNQALQDLRNDALLGNSLITTYTYNAQMQVSTITDTRGYTMTFHYDQENRLLYVTDPDDNVLSKNEYNFKLNN